MGGWADGWMLKGKKKRGRKEQMNEHGWMMKKKRLDGWVDEYMSGTRWADDWTG